MWCVNAFACLYNLYEDEVCVCVCVSVVGKWGKTEGRRSDHESNVESAEWHLRDIFNIFNSSL